MIQEAPSVGPLADPVEEASRIASAAEQEGLALRVGGGVAVAMRCPSAHAPPLQRVYADIDLFGTRRESKRIDALMLELEYEPDREFNVLHGDRRLYYWDARNGRQVDVFLDVFEMCHRIDLSARVVVAGATLPAADLLLCKLQVVETNEKDLQDILALLLDHAFTDDESGINLAYLAALTAADWGLWKTTTMVAERADHHARQIDGLRARGRARDQVRTLLARLVDEPKSRRWQLRARVGERVRWYDLPEEAH
jgi:hypothetical protein